MKTEKLARARSFPTPLFATCLGHFVGATHTHESAEDVKPQRRLWILPQKKFEIKHR